MKILSQEFSGAHLKLSLRLRIDFLFSSLPQFRKCVVEGGLSVRDWLLKYVSEPNNDMK